MGRSIAVPCGMWSEVLRLRCAGGEGAQLCHRGAGVALGSMQGRALGEQHWEVQSSCGVWSQVGAEILGECGEENQLVTSLGLYWLLGETTHGSFAFCWEILNL